MLQVGRLLTLRGAYDQASGNWEEAAVIYFDGLRMGRHMSHQPTVAEALGGLEILRNNYYALSHWAVSCPEPKMAGRAFGLLESVSDDMIAPARTMVGESSILAQRLGGLLDAFPAGPWAELILEDLGEEFPDGNADAVRKAAIAACESRGVPQDVFRTLPAFRKHVKKIRDVNVRFTEAAAACMSLPPTARLKRGQEIYDDYAKLAGELGDDLAVNPNELGRLFAIHDAELMLARVTLALCANRSEAGLPQSLDAVASGFGGQLPVSPYDGSPLVYQLSQDAQSFTLGVPKVQTEYGSLPEITFESVTPIPVAE